MTARPKVRVAAAPQAPAPAVHSQVGEEGTVQQGTVPCRQGTGWMEGLRVQGLRRSTVELAS